LAPAEVTPHVRNSNSNNLLRTAHTPFGTLIGAIGLCSETLRLADIHV